MDQTARQTSAQDGDSTWPAGSSPHRVARELRPPTATGASAYTNFTKYLPGSWRTKRRISSWSRAAATAPAPKPL